MPAKPVVSTTAERCFVDVVPPGETVGSLDDQNLRFIRRILFLARRWRNLLDEHLRDTGDSHARWLTLTWVDLLAGRGNHRELAERVGVELPTLIRLLNKLEHEGLVVRRALGDSAQSKTVVLTRKGRTAFRRMTVVVSRTRKGFLEGIDEVQLRGALSLLDGLVQRYARVVQAPGLGLD